MRTETGMAACVAVGMLSILSILVRGLDEPVGPFLGDALLAVAGLLAFVLIIDIVGSVFVDPRGRR